MNRRYSERRITKLILLLAAAVLLLTAVYRGGRWLEQRSLNAETRGDHTLRLSVNGKVLEHNGIAYRRRSDVTAILIMGVDKTPEASPSRAINYRNGGQADFLRLIVIDHGQRKVSQLEIDRDTMTPITILGVLGDRSGMRTAQISLSHAFGDTPEQNCELTVEAVSNLLCGETIELYAAMSLDGIPALNDLVGGVTVTLEDDFSAQDASMTQGATLTLSGRQAEIYVRSRMSVGQGTNVERMARQDVYLAGLADKLDQLGRENEAFGGELFDALEPYLTTNMSRGRIVNEMWRAREYERAKVIHPQGVHQIGADGFSQFYVDEDALMETVLALFYEA